MSLNSTMGPSQTVSAPASVPVSVPTSVSNWPSVAPVPTLQTVFPASVPVSVPTSDFTYSPTAISSKEESGFDYGVDTHVWLIMWLITMVVFILLPITTSKRRRELCMRGIRERRWIRDEEYDENGSGDHQGTRRPPQQRDRTTQRHFTTTRTQEDDIRQQYLSVLMKNYTIVLSKSDICGGDDNSEESMVTWKETTLSLKEEKKSQIENDVENQCDTTIVLTDSGSKDTDDDQVTTDIETPTPVREKRSDTEDSGDLLAFEFDKDQTVCVPLSGQAVVRKNKDEEQAEQSPTTSSACASTSSSTSRRLVSNGCAICLCRFEAEEEITWSSNPDCCHVFHRECIINWYLAVGKKTQQRRKKNNPAMTNEEALDLICEFPILCPCCRQEFCTNQSSLSCETCLETGSNSETAGV